jgi:hypothetical protein
LGDRRLGIEGRGVRPRGDVGHSRRPTTNKNPTTAPTASG